MPCVTKEVSGPQAENGPTNGNGNGNGNGGNGDDGFLSPQAVIGLGIAGATALIVLSNRGDE